MNVSLQMHSEASAVRENSCVKQMLNKLYEDRDKTGDIKFVIGAEEISAHRNILAALSPKFEAQFYGSMADQDIINVEDVSAAAFKEFLQFFYKHDVTLTIDNIEDVLNLAKQSLVDELIEECIQFLLDVIGIDKLVWCYRLALQYDIQPLERFCVQQIGRKIKSVFQTADFLSCEREMLCRILDLQILNCNEVEVFDACVSWARKSCEQNGMDGTITENIRAALGEAFFKIRFCSMSVEQFASIDKMYSGLLSTTESIEIYRTIGLKAKGEVSDIFGESSSKKRKSMQALSCSFRSGPPKKRNLNDGDFIKFSCDKTINLNGFIICQAISNEIDVKVKTSDVEQSVECTKSHFDNKTVITFDNPIQVKCNEWCRIYFTLRTFNQSNNNLYGYNVRNTTQHGVLFKFDDDLSVAINLITRLLFNIDDEY